jgi:ubiquinone/menaquinone biosynthesis C-methylase UbiE
MKKSKKHDLRIVKEHYEDYPYPLRNPEDEKKRLQMTLGTLLGEINHWLYKGKQSFQSGFRILDAGGGTGDTVIFLAEQLKEYPNSEVFYLDFSKSSMEIAKERAKIRGLSNITWINGNILNIPYLKLGKFDFINCVGVLHHMKSPEDGIKILQESLVENGGMHIMVYAQYGRTGIYHVQEIMKMINKKVNDRKKEVKNTWSVINNLPETNWYNRGSELLADHITDGDVGCYDMFLHKQDRAYTIPQLYKFVESSGMKIVEFSNTINKIKLNPKSFIVNKELLKKLSSLEKKEQQAIAELMIGNIAQHCFWTSNKYDSIASFNDLNNIPYFRGTIENEKNAKELFLKIYNFLEQHSQIKDIKINFDKLSINLSISEYSKYILKYIIDSDKSLKEIFNLIKKILNHNISDEKLLLETKKLLEPLIDNHIILLRDKSIKPFIINDKCII